MAASPSQQPDGGRPRRLLARGSWPEAKYVGEALRTETVGGAILLGAAVLAMVWANSPWYQSYEALRDTAFGPEALHLDLTFGVWSADLLLALFFLVAGIELKREFVAGDLADRQRAALPIAAAASGVAVPAILYLATVVIAGSDAVKGWAIPTATDIAFALAVLAVIGTHLPSALRSFLLTLAVVDDLIAITIIAVFYTADLNLLALAASVIPFAAWRWFLRRGWTNPLLLAVPALLAWDLVHASGVHATVAGVLLGLLVPVDKRAEAAPDRHSLAESIEHNLRPWSAGVAVPLFAFFAAGIHLGAGGVEETFADPAAIGVIIGLVVGKTVGVFGGTWLFARFTKAELDEDLAWRDVFGLSLLGGIGFTVSLLIAELAFEDDPARAEHVRLAVLIGSVIAAALAAIVLRARNRHYREIAVLEEQDADADGIPDVYDDDPRR